MFGSILSQKKSGSQEDNQASILGCLIYWAPRMRGRLITESWFKKYTFSDFLCNMLQKRNLTRKV